MIGAGGSSSRCFASPWSERVKNVRQVLETGNAGAALWSDPYTYIPMRGGFLYLAAVMDWATRRVLTWRPSNTLDASFSAEALEEALRRYGKPEIFNSDAEAAGSPRRTSSACSRTPRSEWRWTAGAASSRTRSSSARVLAQARGGLSAPTDLGPRGPRHHRRMDGVLQ